MRIGAAHIGEYRVNLSLFLAALQSLALTADCQIPATKDKPPEQP
jgi:hypothetical protein